MDAAPVIFDRAAVRRKRDRAAVAFERFDFLFAEVAGRLAERLVPIRRPLTVALDLGCHTGGTAAHLDGRNAVTTLIGCDSSPAMAVRAAGRPGLCAAVAAEEDCLPFRAGSFDLVVSNLSLHWVNDLPGALLQIRQLLKPDGFFLGALLGGRTLCELRHCLLEAESMVCGGVSPRVSPFPDLADMARLLTRAGFAEPVADSETLTVSYADLFQLMADLRGMGETNAVVDRRRQFPPRTLFAAAAQRYGALFAEPDGRLPATVEIHYLAGWGPTVTDASSNKN